MPRITRAVVVVYLLFNLSIALTLIFDPSSLDLQYRGEAPITPTREFLWWSTASMHLFLVLVTSATLWMRIVSERRFVLLANAAFYLWDAITQWAYWGAHVGLSARDLHVNAGVSAVVAAIVAAAALYDRDQSPARPRSVMVNPPSTGNTSNIASNPTE